MNIYEERVKELFAQEKNVRDEMAEKGNKGILWKNGDCKAWPDYEKATTNLYNLRNIGE